LEFGVLRVTDRHVNHEALPGDILMVKEELKKRTRCRLSAVTRARESSEAAVFPFGMEPLPHRARLLTID
jgi:hypothetical protein